MLGLYHITAMGTLNSKEPIILFLGDVALFYLSLWLALLIRYVAVPSSSLLVQHMGPFSFIFVIWVLVFFIAGLYEQHTLFFQSKLSSILLRAQIINSAIAAIFFYMVPIFGITPKTNLFIDLTISFFLILVWRISVIPVLGIRRRQAALLIGSGPEMKELKNEVNHNMRYGLSFVRTIDLDHLETFDFQNDVLEAIYTEGITTVVVDLKNPKVAPLLPHLYNLMFSRVHFIDMHRVYGDIFDRAPLSLVGYNWFLANISSSTHIAYDALKRFMDFTVALFAGVVSLIVYPFIIIAIKLEDGGPAFIAQERVGKGNRSIRLWKFRSMRANDMGVWPTKTDTRVTNVGRVLRVTRLDELPQLWNVVVGDISLIGPRPDIIDLGKKLETEIPYYNIRYLIKPGLSGWAQIKQDLPPHSIEETKIRLAYDLYYIKNRSLVLDIKIALKTIKTLLSRTGK
ncbi:MAG: exopolysaccharide biosynthesis polyprenyl glycosylphosphotransferase [Minisyncoccota bacterium]